MDRGATNGEMSRIEMELKCPGPGGLNVFEIELRAVEDKGVWYLETRCNGKCWRDKVENAEANRANTEAATFTFMHQAATCIRNALVSEVMK
jgi:hypothetical protein